MPRTPDWNSTISSAASVCIRVSLDHWGLPDHCGPSARRAENAVTLTLDIAQTVDTAERCTHRQYAETTDETSMLERQAHRAIPSPMLRTRPVSAVAVSALLPEILCSRMDETSDAAALGSEQMKKRVRNDTVMVVWRTAQPLLGPITKDSPGFAVA